jgi:hypothetical protein
VKHLFEDLISQGHDPQILNAYNQQNNLLHLNHIYPALKSSIAYVYLSLEKQMFHGSCYPGGQAWQFYVNLIKVQVMQPSVPVKPVVMKQAEVHGYDFMNRYQGNLSQESKHVKWF